MRRRLLWIPILLVGAAVYWTLALGSAGISVAVFSGAAGSMDPDEPEYVEDQLGEVISVGLVDDSPEVVRPALPAELVQP